MGFAHLYEAGFLHYVWGKGKERKGGGWVKGAKRVLLLVGPPNYSASQIFCLGVVGRWVASH